MPPRILFRWNLWSRRAPILPHHIIEEILSRLPVKSILRNRCVRKTWCNLSSDPAFISLHLNRSTEGGAIHINVNSLQSRPYLLYSLDPENPSQVVNSGSDFIHLGSCDGMLCLAEASGSGRNVHVLNPSTRKNTRIRELQYDVEVHGESSCFVWDPISCDYQLLIARKKTNNNGVCSTELMAHMMGGDTWKILMKDIPYKHFRPSIGQPVNGAIHWLAVPSYEHYSTGKWVLIAIDPCNLQFQEVPQPRKDDADITTMHHTAVAGCLSIILIKTTVYEVWLMKEYGVKDSWTKSFVFPQWAGEIFAVPLCIRNDGFVLFHVYEYGLLWWNNEKQYIQEIAPGTSNEALQAIAYDHRRYTWNETRAITYDHRPYTRAITYVQSLASVETKSTGKQYIVARKAIHPRVIN